MMNMSDSICDPQYRVSGGQEMDVLVLNVKQRLEFQQGGINYFIEKDTEV